MFISRKEEEAMPDRTEDWGYDVNMPDSEGLEAMIEEWAEDEAPGGGRRQRVKGQGVDRG